MFNTHQQKYSLISWYTSSILRFSMIISIILYYLTQTKLPLRLIEILLVIHSFISLTKCSNFYEEGSKKLAIFYSFFYKLMRFILYIQIILFIEAKEDYKTFSNSYLIMICIPTIIMVTLFIMILITTFVLCCKKVFCIKGKKFKLAKKSLG